MLIFFPQKPKWDYLTLVRLEMIKKYQLLVMTWEKETLYTLISTLFMETYIRTCITESSGKILPQKKNPKCMTAIWFTNHIMNMSEWNGSVQKTSDHVYCSTIHHTIHHGINLCVHHYIHIRILCSYKKQHHVTCDNMDDMEDILSNEINQMQKDKYYITSFFVKYITKLIP